MPNFISEDSIEQATLQKLHREYGFQLLNCHTTDPEDLNDRSNRRDKREVILGDRLKTAALRLNPSIPETAIDQSLAILTQQRSAMSLIAANREIDRLLRDGIPIEYENAQGRTEPGRVRIIDFNDPNPSGNNEFLAVSQLWIRGDIGFRRPDILLYINGLPLVFIELKNSNVNLKNAFDDNLNNYKRDIPQLFHPNAVCRVHPTFVTLTLNPSPKAGEGLPIRLPFSLFWEKGLGDGGRLAELGYARAIAHHLDSRNLSSPSRIKLSPNSKSCRPL
ncbi:MAG: hypothetical protein OHK0037_39010 [Elainellaceae cyanobacterium]